MSSPERYPVTKSTIGMPIKPHVIRKILPPTYTTQHSHVMFSCDVICTESGARRKAGTESCVWVGLRELGRKAGRNGGRKRKGCACTVDGAKLP